MIPFGPFRPDAAGPNSRFAAEADNVLPQAYAMPKGGEGIAYGPFPALVTAPGAEALPGAPRGLVSVVTADGTWQVYAATATTIEQLDSTFQWTSVATGLTVTAGDDMSFCHYGSYLLNSNTTDGFNAYNVESPAGNNAVSGAPKARFIFSANNVVVALDCDGNNRRMQTSGIGDHTAWTSKGADGRTFADGGALVCGLDLQNGAALIFQDAAIRLMQFGGAPGGALYQITKVADGRGSVGARSVVSFDGQVFYLASDGFYRFTLSGGSQAIGAEKINRWFLGRVNAEDLVKVEGSVDPQNKIIVWRYRASDVTSATVFEDAIGYDWQLNEWFTLTVDTAAVSRIATVGYTVDGPYAEVLVDDNPTYVDDRLYQGGQPVFAALDGDLKFATFSGTPMAATLETTLVNSPVTGLIGWATPIDDAPAGTLQLGVTDSLATATTWKTGATRGASGRVGLRGRGMNVAFRRNIPAGTTWSFAHGVDHVQSASGGPK